MKKQNRKTNLRMNIDHFIAIIRQARQALLLWLQVIILALATTLPVLMPGRAFAGEQLTSRKVTIDSAKSAKTAVGYTFAFTVGTSTDIEGMIFEYCTTALGTCTKPTGLDVSHPTASPGTQTGFPNNATAFTEQTASLGDCNIAGTSADTKYCVKRTEATAGTGAMTFIINNVTNPTFATPFTTVYIRISLYDNASFSSSGGTGNSIVNNGTVAASINNQLTVNGRVQEKLEFCVASIDDVAALPSSCTTVPTTTTIDIGVIDSSTISQSPVNVTATNGANDFYGMAMLTTNASGGAVVTFLPEAAATGTNSLRSFRVTGASCNASGTSVVDQCFIDANAAGETFVSGTERFGTVVPCIDTTQGTTTNLGSVPAAYSGTDATTTSAADCENEANTKFAWNNTASPVTIASASTVVDREILKLRFGATASTTTPTGAYTVTTMYIATPTF